MADTVFGPTGWTPDRLGRQDHKTFLISGANSGTGFEAARILASKGAEVVMLNRSAERSEVAMARLRAALGGDVKVSFVHLDLASLGSVRKPQRSCSRSFLASMRSSATLPSPKCRPRCALGAMSPGDTVIVMSTVSPTYCKELAVEVADAGIKVLDCPVSGMVKVAVDGTLTLMIGGEVADIDRCRAVLEPMGTVLHCGPVGSGQVMKLGNNAMAIGTFGLLMEVRDMVAAQGMDLDTFMEFLNHSTGRSFVTENWPMPPERITFTGMPVKDMRRCLAAGEDVDVAMPMLARLLEAGASDNEGPGS